MALKDRSLEIKRWLCTSDCNERMFLVKQDCFVNLKKRLFCSLKIWDLRKS